MSKEDKRCALTLLATQYSKSVYRFAFARTGDTQIAADVRQQVFLEAYRDLDRYANRSSLRSWLFGIARHRCVDAARASRRWNKRFKNDEPVEHAAADPTLECELDRSRLQRILSESLAKLTPAAREAIVLRYQDELSYGEMAAIVGDSESTVQQRVRRALPLLRKYFQDQLRPAEL
jgi:RNA polymerase sigma-70 factor (ECF subfamily)